MSENRSSTVLVELVRLTVVVASTAAGYEIARTPEPDAGAVALGALLGSAVGYVLGGVLGRTVRSLVGGVEHRLAAVPGADLVAGGLGMIGGLLAGSVLGWPLLLLPTRAVGVAALAFELVVLGYLGFRLGVLKREDLLQLFGLAFRTRARDLRVLDTSAILDTRLLDLVRGGFLRGTMLVPQFVLEEAQAIADGGDAVRRQRARRGLEALAALKREALVDLRVVDKTYPEYDQVDAKVIALARDRGGAVVTNDIALGRVAELQGIEVLSVTALANILRPSALPGETIRVMLVKAGREPGQAVGYLDDGAMLIVEGARRLVGEAVDVVVSSIVQTAGGKLLFAKLAGSGSSPDVTPGEALDPERPAGSAPQRPADTA